ncbi:MAG: hypothetical protein HQM03_02930 [Magnetococcales bacterium]|nr:hypothetical protein [Magnetococcales bacterium]
MESIEVANIKPGQSVTLDFGNKTPILTRLEEPRKFKIEEWYPEEREIWLLDDVIAEDEPLRYCFDPKLTLAEALRADQKIFGQNRKLFDFMGRVVGGIEMEEEEEDEEGEDEDDGG